MTDCEKFKNLLIDFNVPYEEEVNEEAPDEINNTKVYPKTIDITVNDLPCEKICSYSGFFFSFRFDKDGKFLHCGAGE